MFELEGAERTIVFRDVPQRPALSVLRGFSAPVRVDDDLTEEDLVVLSRHDSDNFNRWQAAAKPGDARSSCARRGYSRRPCADATADFAAPSAP